jgi:hypothetical protein
LRPVQGIGRHADIAEGVMLDPVIIHDKSIASIRTKVKQRRGKAEAEA